VLTVILKITGGIRAVLAVIVTMMTVTGRSMCRANINCDINREVYMHCKHIFGQ
jgi:hypothetical protein